jgi:C1A family cysteine protease
MNEYFSNISENKKKDRIINKNKPKYRMGWKIKEENILIEGTNKTVKQEKNIKTDNNIKYNDKIKKKRYNIYEKYPEYFPEIMEQGDIDACVPNCISTVYYYNTFKQGNYLNFRISRLFLYYYVRKEYNELSDDGGARIIDCIKILEKSGVPPEMTHPYHDKFIYKEPNETSTKLAKYCKLLGFKEIKRNKIKKRIIENNLVICGIKIYENFNNKNTIITGHVNLPKSEEKLLGGHSIIIVGYDEKNYIFLNSWGKSWGDNGIGYLPFEYIENYNLSDEFFIITKISNPIIDFISDNQNYTINKIFDNIKIINNYDKNTNKSFQLIKILIISILIIIFNI